MTSIRGIGKIIEILRSQALDDVRSESGRTLKKKTSSPNKSNIHSLENRLIKRIQSLDVDASDFYSKASQVFICSVLSWELGEEILENQEVSELIDVIYNQIASDPSLKDKLDLLIRRLHDSR